MYNSQLARPRACVEEGQYDPTNMKHLGACSTDRSVFHLRNEGCLDYMTRGAGMVFSQGCMTHTVYFDCSFMDNPSVVRHYIMRYDDDLDKFKLWY